MESLATIPEGDSEPSLCDGIENLFWFSNLGERHSNLEDKSKSRAPDHCAVTDVSAFVDALWPPPQHISRYRCRKCPSTCLSTKSSIVSLSFSLLSRERKSNKLEVAAPPDLASRTSCETTSPKRWKGKFSWVLQCQIVSCPRVDEASSLFCCRGSDDAGVLRWSARRSHWSCTKFDSGMRSSSIFPTLRRSGCDCASPGLETSPPLMPRLPYSASTAANQTSQHEISW